jgi:hypothetical protein
MALTKPQLVAQFNAYDNDTLERLHLLAKTVIVPQRDQLIQVDFARMVEYAHTLADQFFPEWTDRSKSDFGEFIIELQALFSDKDFFYINAMFREAFLMRADRYSNLVHASISKGYKTPGRVSARGLFDVTFGPGAEEVVPRGAIEYGVRGMELLSFSNESFTIPESLVDVVVQLELYHGVVKEYSLNYGGATILLTDEGICDKSIYLTVDGDVWTEVDTFFNGTAASKNFLVLYNELSQAEIHFPKEAQFGLRPRFGAAVDAVYRVGGGNLGNLAADTLTTVMKGEITREIVMVAQPTPLTGGEEQLSKAFVRHRALSWQRTKGHAINTYTMGLLAKEVTGVHNAFATSIGNLFYLFIVPKGGGMPSAELKQTVYDHVEGHLIMHHAVYVESPYYNNFTMSLDLYVLPNVSNSGAKTIAEGIVKGFTNAGEQGEFGMGIVRTQLAALLYTQISGLQNVDFQQLYLGAPQVSPPAANDIIVPPGELMDWVNASITINVFGGRA